MERPRVLEVPRRCPRPVVQSGEREAAVHALRIGEGGQQALDLREPKHYGGAVA